MTVFSLSLVNLCRFLAVSSVEHNLCTLAYN